MESVSRFLNPPVDHFFLLGPRGRGKTWLTRRLFPQALRVDLLEPETLRSLSARPERLREMIGGRPFRCRRLSRQPAASPLDAPSEIDGAALESLLAQHLRAWCDYSDGNHRLYYWQTRSKLEVDFVVYGESGLYALKVKNTSRVRPEDLRGLKSFGDDFPESHRWLLYRGKERLLCDGILCMPCEEFLLQLKPGEFPTEGSIVR